MYVLNMLCICPYSFLTLFSHISMDHLFIQNILFILHAFFLMSFFLLSCMDYLCILDINLLQVLLRVDLFFILLDACFAVFNRCTCSVSVPSVLHLLLSVLSTHAWLGYRTRPVLTAFAVLYLIFIFLLSVSSLLPSANTRHSFFFCFLG